MEGKQITILVATGLYPPEIGGPATYTQMLEQRLPEHGFSLAVVPYGKVRQLSKWKRHFAYAKLLYHEAKSADVIYALDPVSVGLPAWLIAFVTRKPFMVRLGGDYAWEQGQQRFGLTMTLDEYTKHPYRAPFKVRLLAFVQRFVVVRAKRVIVPSDYLRAVVETWGVTPKRLRVIYSALFPLKVEEKKEVLRTQLSFKQFTITSIGRLVPWKGFLALINVVYALKRAGKPVTLVIAGDGPSEEVIKRKIKDLGLTEEVRLVGRLTKDTLGAIIKASDCFVLNTGYEGLSHQLLEVMDLGVPVVTTNVGGNPELITDGVSGLLVPFDDEAELQSAIGRLMDNESLRQRLVQSARVRTRDFSEEKVVVDLAELIRHEVL